MIMNRLETEWLPPKWLEKYRDTLPLWLREIAGDVAQATSKTLLAEARRNLTPEGGLGLHKRSGKLLRSLALKVQRDGGMVTGVSMSYAEIPGRILNDGGVIKPKGGREYLVFRVFRDGDSAEATGPWVSTKSVIIKPFHWLDKARDKAMDKVMPAFQRAVQKAVR